ncbi:MAG: NADH-quinone oxidoreductase subunit J [Gammaproteobacteria bacterium]|nr:NADH-quinone oxidoreductase subunit J [Gammaproteobacteria bacterium]
MINLPVLVFYAFASLLVLSSAMVIISRNPVRGALFLVLAFFASSVLWMLMEAEFLALALIFVYVGAVMTLFLFVVMMLNLDLVPSREGFVRYLPFGILVMVLFVSVMIIVITPEHFKLGSTGAVVAHPEGYSNVKEIGEILYTQYFYPFELAAILLLTAIIAAITLTFRGRQHSRVQLIKKQLSATKADRMYLVDPKESK